MGVLRQFRDLPDAIAELARCTSRVAERLESLIQLQISRGASDERLLELEITRAKWEAEMEAILMKSDGTLKAAANAESRSRTMLRHAEKLADPLDFEGEEEQEALPLRYAEGSETEGVLPVRMDVAPTDKENRLRMKFS